MKTIIPVIHNKPLPRFVPVRVDRPDLRAMAFWQSWGGLRDAPQLTDLRELARAIRAHARSL